MPWWHVRICNRHLPFLNLKENLVEKFPSDLQIVLSEFRCWEFSTIPPDSEGEIRNSDGNLSARLSVRLKKRRCLINQTPCVRLPLLHEYVWYTNAPPWSASPWTLDADAHLHPCFMSCYRRILSCEFLAAGHISLVSKTSWHEFQKIRDRTTDGTSLKMR